MSVQIDIFNPAKDKSKELLAIHDYMLNVVQDYFKPTKVNGRISFFPNNLFMNSPTKDVDIFMIGEFDNLFVKDANDNSVQIKRFSTIIEAKNHSANGVHVNGQNLFVEYPGQPDHNVTLQCKKEIDVMSSKLKLSGIGTWVTGLIWLYGMTEKELCEIVPESSNAIAIDTDFSIILQLIISQSHIYNRVLDCSFNNDSFYDDIVRYFTSVNQGKSLSNIKSLNIFSSEKGKKLYDNLKKDDSINVICGRAGTGKTISLLQLASYLATEKNKKCLVITYNTALVSDIRRTLEFAYFISQKNIDVFSQHKFFDDCMKTLNIWDESGNYKEDYEKSIYKFVDIPNAGDQLSLEYDYVFADEAQDWSKVEQTALLKLFPPSKIVVADGIDQFISSNKRIDWGDVEPLTMSLRQKTNIVSFINAFSNETNIGWKVEPNPQFAGGEVIIKKSLSPEFLGNVINDAKKLGCTNYDILILVPDVLTANGEFSQKAIYEQQGYYIFDGTNKTIRDKGYPTDGKQLCRVYKYNGCRGLEGWATVCLRFDKMIKEITGDNPSTKKKLEAYLWSIMPLTRAVDKLIITLKDPDCEVGRILKRLCGAGYATWNC